MLEFIKRNPLWVAAVLAAAVLLRALWILKLPVVAGIRLPTPRSPETSLILTFTVGLRFLAYSRHLYAYPAIRFSWLPSFTSSVRTTTRQ